MAASKKPMRNWAAIDPLMRKGGAHSVPKQRLRPRQDRRAALDDYDAWCASDNMGDDNEGPQGPSAFLATANEAKVHLQYSTTVWQLRQKVCCDCL